jgi:hypothetical protein
VDEATFSEAPAGVAARVADQVGHLVHRDGDADAGEG